MQTVIPESSIRVNKRLVPESFDGTIGHIIEVKPSRYSVGYTYPVQGSFEATMQGRAEAFAMSQAKRNEDLKNKTTIASYDTSREATFETQALSNDYKKAKQESIETQRMTGCINAMIANQESVARIMWRKQESMKLVNDFKKNYGFDLMSIADPRRTRREGAGKYRATVPRNSLSNGVQRRHIESPLRRELASNGNSTRTTPRRELENMDAFQQVRAIQANPSGNVLMIE
jgi:hypothetical protein